MATQQEEPEAAAMQQRTRASARIPKFPLDDALELARVVLDMGGAVSKARIAGELDASTASSGFKSRLASAQYFGLIERTDDGKYQASERATTILGDDDRAGVLARRHAILATGMGPVLVKQLGKQATEQLLRVRMEEELDVPAGTSRELAVALLASLEQAQMISGGRLDAAAIEEASESLPKQEDPSAKPRVRMGRTPRAPRPQPAAAKAATAAAGAPKGTAAAPPARQSSNGGAGKVERPPLGAAVKLSISLNVAHLGVDEIVELVRKLRGSVELS